MELDKKKLTRSKVKFLISELVYSGYKDGYLIEIADTTSEWKEKYMANTLREAVKTVFGHIDGEVVINVYANNQVINVFDPNFDFL